MSVIFDILCRLIQIAQIAIIAWIVLFYIVELGRIPWGHPVRKVYDFLGRLIDPVISPIRRVVPPLRLGATALDLSPIILIVGLAILSSIVCRLG